MVPELAEVTGKGAKLLQIARSTPRLLTALVGHKTPMYVEENLLLTRVPPMDEGRFASVMTQLK